MLKVGFPLCLLLRSFLFQELLFAHLTLFPEVSAEFVWLQNLYYSKLLCKIERWIVL